jgi:hypothetical protein
MSRVGGNSQFRDLHIYLSVSKIKEESDTMVANGLEPKDSNAAVSKKAREWFFEQLNKEAGL